MVNVMKKKAIDREILTIFDLVIAKNRFIKKKIGLKIFKKKVTKSWAKLRKLRFLKF